MNPNSNQTNWIFGMLTDPTNQFPGSSSNPGSSTQPQFNNQMPYYPNYQPQFANQDELLMFQQFKMQQMHQHTNTNNNNNQSHQINSPLLPQILSNNRTTLSIPTKMSRFLPRYLSLAVVPV